MTPRCDLCRGLLCEPAKALVKKDRDGSPVLVHRICEGDWNTREQEA